MLPVMPRSPGCHAVVHKQANHWPMHWAGMLSRRHQTRLRRICFGRHRCFLHQAKTLPSPMHHDPVRTTGLPGRAASSNGYADFWCVKLVLTEPKWPSWGTGATALPCAANQRPLSSVFYISRRIMTTSTTTRQHRHWRSALAIVFTASLALSACSSDDDGENASSGNGDWEPVTIDSALGTATIEEEPERIVTLGQGSTETVIALGTTPVGMEEYTWGADDSGYLPWIEEEVTERGDELPELFTGATELDIEAILELEPDLIL